MADDDSSWSAALLPLAPVTKQSTPVLATVTARTAELAVERFYTTFEQTRERSTQPWTRSTPTKEM